MEDVNQEISLNSQSLVTRLGIPPQWVRCDLRTFDMTILGKFSIIMADPPWDIHM
jgi:mRNA (2'-O-methyladenosine-N6-)-methyltransferase